MLPDTIVLAGPVPRGLDFNLLAIEGAVILRGSAGTEAKDFCQNLLTLGPERLGV